MATQGEVRELQSLLDRARSQRDSLQRQVVDQSAELDALRVSVKSSRNQLATSQRELDHVKAELRTQSGTFQDMQAEREMAQAEVGPVKFLVTLVQCEIWQDCIPSGHKPDAPLSYMQSTLKNALSMKIRLGIQLCPSDDKLMSTA